jgi:hypothetical protein
MAIAALSYGLNRKTMKKPHKDRFDIEKEQRTQNRVMGGCALTIIALLVLMIILGSCKSNEHTWRTETDSITADTDSLQARSSRTDSAVIDWLTFAIQHLRMQLCADSVTLPSGAVIHAPRLMAEADSLTAGKGTVAALHRETADSAASRASIQSARREASDRTRDTTAVYDPPDTDRILTAALLIILASLAAVILTRKLRQRRK